MGGGKIMKKFFFFLGTCIVMGSCSTGNESAIATLLLGGSSQAPVFLNYRTVSENEITFEFSQAVKVTSLGLEPDIGVASVEDGNIVKVTLKENTEPGMLLTADLLAEDEHRNTINVVIPFRTRNNRMPKLVINEICTEYNGTAAIGKKEEFIEFNMKSAGNLGAMRIVINGNSNTAKKTVYEFSPVEVKNGEYMTLHLRTFDPSSENEYGENIDESAGILASPTARDFWIPGSSKLLHKTAMIYVLDQDDRVIDAVILSETPDTWWTKDYFAETAEFLFNSGAWKSPAGGVCSPKDAVASKDSTNTRTICRDETVEDSDTAKDWYITATSSATPGKPNNPKRYVPK
jgi:hypothetical protein